MTYQQFLSQWSSSPVAAGGFRELHRISGRSLADLSREYRLPLRTLENWSGGQREAPPYVLQLLAFAILSDKDE